MMRLLKALAGLAGGVVVIIIVFLVWAHRGEIAVAQPPSTFDPQVVARGAALAAMGNCGSCHTVVGGAPFAGGPPVPTQFGTIYGSNISPDPETGIGLWSQEAFARALRQGVDREGNHLYPAFPYDHFTQLNDDDVKALYAYMMTRTPVRAANPVNELAFPFGFRPLLAGWKLLFFEPGRFTADPAASTDANRGAYLTEALAHCGACHTPRNVWGAEQRRHALAGGVSGTWAAPAIDAENPAPMPWTTDQLQRYLRTGRAPHHGVAAGPMQEVTRNLAWADDNDVRAVAAFVASRLATSSQERGERAKGLLARTEQRLPVGPSAAETVGAGQASASAGATLYAGACAVCHDAGRTGGMDGIDLSLATGVQLKSPRNFLQVVLSGIHSPEGEMAVLMPGFDGALTDAQIVELATYVRATFTAEPPWPHLAATLAEVRQNKIASSAEAR